MWALQLSSEILTDELAKVADLATTADYGENLSYGELCFLVLQAVLQTVVVCLLGYGAARMGYLNRQAQRNISHLNVMVFTPCLIFSKMASSLSISALGDLVLIPMLFAVSTGVSYTCGRLLSRTLDVTDSESNFVVAMAVFGNSNSLPVSLTVSLAYSLPFLTWPDLPDDTRDNVASRGLLYLLIFQQLGQMLRWSWGYNTLLAKAPCGLEDDESMSSMGDLEPLSFFPSVFHQIKQFMNPPLWAMLAALFVASVPPLKAALYESDGFLANTVGKSTNQVGGIAIPLILIVLGSNLASTGDEAHLVPSPRYAKIVAASLLSRMVLPSLVMLPLLALCVKYLGVSILDDPIFLVSSFILTISPPAIQLSQICQLNSVHETEMAGVLFWGYVVLTLPTTILIVVAALGVLKWSGISDM